MDDFTVKQAADILGTSSETLRRWEKEDKLSFHVEKTTGGHRRYPQQGILLLREKLLHAGKPVVDVAVLQSIIKAAKIEAAHRLPVEFGEKLKPFFDSCPTLVGLGLLDPNSSGDGGYVCFCRHMFDVIIRDDQGLRWLMAYKSKDAAEIENILPGLDKFCDEYIQDSPEKFESLLALAGKKYDLLIAADGYALYDWHGAMRVQSGISNIKEINELILESDMNLNVSRGKAKNMGGIEYHHWSYSLPYEGETKMKRSGPRVFSISAMDAEYERSRGII